MAVGKRIVLLLPGKGVGSSTVQQSSIATCQPKTQMPDSAAGTMVLLVADGSAMITVTVILSCSRCSGQSAGNQQMKTVICQGGTASTREAA